MQSLEHALDLRVVIELNALPLELRADERMLRTAPGPDRFSFVARGSLRGEPSRESVGYALSRIEPLARADFPHDENLVNSHFISRFLTKPWEHGQRMLSILDLGVGRLLPPASSESAFAIDGLFSDEMERWFDRAFESPLADWRARLLRGENPRASWRVYRAMVLAILWASPRVTAARSIAQQTVHAALQHPLDDGAIDQLVAAVERDSTLVMVPTPPRVPLFFPETAIFGLLVPDGNLATGLGYGFFLPLDPHLALGLVPRGADIDVLRDRWIRDGTLQNASAGHPTRCRRLVVAPSVITLAAADLLDAATRAQSQTASIFADHERARGLVDRMYAIAGLPSPASTKRSRS